MGVFSLVDLFPMSTVASALYLPTLAGHLESETERRSVMYNSLRPHGLYSPQNSPDQNTGVGSLSLPGDLPNPGIEPRSSVYGVLSKILYLPFRTLQNVALFPFFALVPTLSYNLT